MGQVSRCDQHEGVVFDLFHTLVDPEDFRPQGYRRVREVAKLLQVDGEDFERYWRIQHQLANVDRQVTVKGLIQKYLQGLGRDASDELLEKCDQIMGYYQEMAVMNPRKEVLQMLAAFSEHFPLALLSNADEREVRLWPCSPLARYFDTVCFSCDIGAAKPDPRAFEEVLRQAGWSAAKTVFVGDGGSDEFSGARQVGIGQIIFLQAFVACNGMRQPAELAELAQLAHEVVQSHTELAERLLGCSMGKEKAHD